MNEEWLKLLSSVPPQGGPPGPQGAGQPPISDPRLSALMQLFMANKMNPAARGADLQSGGAVAPGAVPEQLPPGMPPQIADQNQAQMPMNSSLMGTLANLIDASIRNYERMRPLMDQRSDKANRYQGLVGKD